MTGELWHELTWHPATAASPVRGITAMVRRADGVEIRVAFRLEGDLSRIRIPAPRPPHIGHELWRHTCFEAFVAIEGRRAYHEFNFSPSGEWTVYAFSDYRQGGPLTDQAMDPQIAARRAADRLELDALIRLDRLSAAHKAAPLRIGLAAVVETDDGLSYWALSHPPGRPDFHRVEGFSLTL
jgi:hypothetical protein